MRFDRRRLLAGSVAWMAMHGAVRADAIQDPGLQDRKSQDHKIQDPGVFWKVTPASAAPSILFGYDVVAAAAAPNLLAIGERLAEPTRHLIIDMPSARFAAKRIEPGTIPPLEARYGTATPRVIDAIRAVAPQWPKPDTLPDVMIALLLFGEGRTPNGTGDTLPATIFGRVFRTGEAVSYLIPFDEVVREKIIPDMTTGANPGTVVYLLDLRAKLGPLGKHGERLYVEERLYDLYRFNLDLLRHGFALIPNVAALRETLSARAVDAIKAARKPTFLMMPSDNFVRDDGILARLAHAGVPIEPAG